MKNSTKNIIAAFFILTIVIFSAGCKKSVIPRPYGYYRVDFPDHIYENFDSAKLPYSFDINKIAQVSSRTKTGEEYWIDILYPSLNASVYCSYKPIHSNLFNLLEDTRKIVYKHSVRADAIDEKLFQNKGRNTYGILYDLKGNTASQLQFIITDSTKNFFRAALYFNNVPNKDSIAPMAEYIRKDMIRMMESFRWKK